jgi:hypothetical protein
MRGQVKKFAAVEKLRIAFKQEWKLAGQYAW